MGARAAGPTHHPLLLLRGISARDMQLILEFVYSGQGECPLLAVHTKLWKEIFFMQNLVYSSELVQELLIQK